MAPLQMAVRASALSTASLHPPYNHMTTSTRTIRHQLHLDKSFFDNNESDDTDDTDYTSELQDLFDQMEQDPQSSSLGVDPEFFAQQNEKRLDCGIPESALRFRTTSYGGRLLNAPHVHPNEHRVVLRVSLDDLKLTEAETIILQEIVGNRLIHARNELRLTSNQFGSRIENKRHLVSMLNRIILSCRRLAGDIMENREREQGRDDGNVEQA